MYKKYINIYLKTNLFLLVQFWTFEPNFNHSKGLILEKPSSRQYNNNKKKLYFCRVAACTIYAHIYTSIDIEPWHPQPPLDPLP